MVGKLKPRIVSVIVARQELDGRRAALQDSLGRWPTALGVQLEPPEAVLTALAHRPEDRRGHGTDGAANPRGTETSIPMSGIVRSLRAGGEEPLVCGPTRSKGPSGWGARCLSRKPTHN